MSEEKKLPPRFNSRLKKSFCPVFHLVNTCKANAFMDPQEEQIFRTYAWSYFSFHADQRMKTFNFFLVVAGLVSGGILTLLKEQGTALIVTPLGASLAFLCLLFWRLDQRNHVLVRNGEAAIKYLDANHNLKTTDGVPHVLCIFEHDDHVRKGQSRSLFHIRNGYFSYSQVIRYVYGLFAILGVFFALLPIFHPQQQMVTAPTPIEIVALPPVSISHPFPASSANGATKNSGDKATKSPK